LRRCLTARDEPLRCSSRCPPRASRWVTARPKARAPLS